MKLHTDVIYKNRKCWVVDRYTFSGKTEYAIKDYKTAEIYFVSAENIDNEVVSCSSIQ